MSNSPVASGNFVFTPTSVAGAIVVEPRVFSDGRGWFMETYKKSDFIAGGIPCEFVQRNQSHSTRGVLRGLHYQVAHPQAKLVRVTKGAVFDVAVDIRPSSPTFGAWVGVTLSEENRKQLFVPRGCAHGFLVLSAEADLCYDCDDVYHPDDEAGIMWNDPDLAVAWPLSEAGLSVSDLVLSDKDLGQGSFAEVSRALRTGAQQEEDA